LTPICFLLFGRAGPGESCHMTHVGSFLDLIFGVATRLTRIGTNLYIADKSKLNDRDGHCSDRKSPDSETSSGVDSPRAHNMNAKATDLEQQNNACLFNTHISEPQS
jgi:hypothetical protein